MDTRLGNLLEQAGLACNSTEAPAAETAPGAEEESHGLTAYTPFISVRACGRLWRLQRAADLETLWNAMLDDPQNFEDERLPYWTELWPSSIALCRWLEERRAEIAGGVGAFHGERHRARTAFGEKDVAVEQIGVGALLETHVGVLQDAQPGISVVGIGHAAVRVEAVGIDVEVVEQDLRPEIKALPRTGKDGELAVGKRIIRLRAERIGTRKEVEVGIDADAVYVIRRMGTKNRVARPGQRVEVKSQARRIASPHGVHRVGNVLLVEVVIAMVFQQSHDARPLAVELIDVEPHARLQERGSRIFPLQDGVDAPIGHYAENLAHPHRLARLHAVAQADLLAFALLLAHDAAVEIAHVLQGLLHLALPLRGEFPVVDHRSIAHAPPHAVEPLGRIAARPSVDIEGNLEKAEPLGVGTLAQIGRKVAHFCLLVCRVDLHIVQQKAPFGHIFRRRAARQKDSKPQTPQNPHKPFHTGETHLLKRKDTA